MSELTRFTSDECLDLTELPPDISTEEATLVAGVLMRLVHHEFQRLQERPKTTKDDRIASEESVMRVYGIWSYADKMTGLVRRAVPDNDELTAIAEHVGLSNDPEVIIDLRQPQLFMSPRSDDLFQDF